MLCLFTLPYRMTTYYAYKITDNEEQAIGVDYTKLWENYDDMCDELDRWLRGLTGRDVKPDRSQIPCLYPCASMVYHKEDGCEAHITRMHVVSNKKETIREIPDLTEIARLLQGDMYKFKKVSVVEEADNCSYNVKYYPQDDDTLAYFLSLILAEHRNQHILLHLHKLADTNRYMIYMAVRDLEMPKYVYQYYVRNDKQEETKTSVMYLTFDGVCDALDKELRNLHGEDWQPRMTREQYKNYMGDDAYAISYDFFKTDTYVLYRLKV